MNNSDDTIDSRDVIARIEELQTDEGINTDSEKDELLALTDLADEASGSPDWEFGETLIRDSYFTEYTQDFAESVGAVDRDLTWPNNHINWDAAAADFQEDYSMVDFDGVTYWIRA